MKKKSRQALRFVLLVGAMSFFADFTYEGARAIAGPHLASVGSSSFYRHRRSARRPGDPGRVDASSLGDGPMLQHRLEDVLELPDVKSRLAKVPGPILVYFALREYVMQGMIADTGPGWRLYEHHQALAMIADWIFHPFRHLQGGHAMHHTGGTPLTGVMAGGAVRRLIFLSVQTTREEVTPASLFAINATRTPRFLVDADIHELDGAFPAGFGGFEAGGRLDREERPHSPPLQSRVCQSLAAAPAIPRKTKTARFNRTMSSSSRRPMRVPIFVLGTVVILSTIKQQEVRRPFFSFGSTGTRNKGASVGSVVNAQIVTELVASNWLSCKITTGRGLPA